MTERSIFISALDKESIAERSEYLDQACGADAVLRERVERLLRAHDEASGFLEPAAAQAADQDRDDPRYAATVAPETVIEQAGVCIGPYKLLQQIGEGGMGTVWMAEQAEPVRRRVALKIIKPGMDTSQVLARFEAERQALAMMDHPNIAKVLDAGTSAGGRPFFVMELVKGTPITRYCDEQRLPVRQRLELFVSVCDAIQHAHQKGIIHRDIKPSNVLVAPYDGKPVVKVIDFGIAKAMGSRLTERTMFTEFGAVIGTLQYMSPEQAEVNNRDVDTRSDIYSLGVMLYELLTGTTPLDMNRLRGAALVAMLAAINTEEPPKPSTRLTQSADSLPSIAAQRQVEPAKLSKLVRGELDWIVMRALEKDRGRRYETASALARDIHRHLCDETVEACPPSAAYRLRKFARRHQQLVTTVIAVFITMSVAITLTTMSLLRAREQERLAVEAEQRALENEQKALAAVEAEQHARAAEIDQRKAAEQALEDAEKAKDRAKTSEAQALNSEQQTQDALARSLLEQARAVRLAGRPGRRARSLELLRQAERLRNRDRAAAPHDGSLTANSTGKAELPSQAELRTEAVAALLLDDGHVAQEWGGMAHAVSPDGRYAASLWVDIEKDSGGLAINDLSTGAEVSKWEGKDAEAISGGMIALGPQAKLLASVATDLKSINVWELPARNLRITLSPPPEPAQAADSKAVARNIVASMPRSRMFLPGLSFSPDGRFVCAVEMSSHGSQLLIWDLQSNGACQVVGLSAPFLHARDFSPDGKLLAFTAGDKTIRLWNVVEKRSAMEIETPLTVVGALGFAPDGRLAVHGMFAATQPGSPPSFGSALLFWDLDAKRETVRYVTSSPSAGFGNLCIAPDGRRAAYGDASGQLTVIDLEKRRPPVILDHEGMPQLLAWSQDGRRLLSGGVGALKSWELTDRLPRSALTLESKAAGSSLLPFAFSPDGKTIAAAWSQGAAVAVFDRGTGRRIRQLDYEPSDARPGNTSAIHFSAGGNQIAKLGDHELVAWNAETGKQLARFRVETDEVKFLAASFRPNGSVVVGGFQKFQSTVWDATAKQVIWQAKDRRTSLPVLSADGRLVASIDSWPTGAERTLSILDLASGQQRLELPGPANKSAQTLGEFSPDGRWLLALHLRPGATLGNPIMGSFGKQTLLSAVSDANFTADIWEVETGRRQMQAAGPSNPMFTTFSPNGRYLAVAMRNGWVRIWDVDSGKELLDWRPTSSDGKTGIATSHIAFTADSTELAASDPFASGLSFLNLTLLNQDFARFGLAW